MSKLIQPASRRNVLSGLGAGALSATASLAQTGKPLAPRPNILLIMADQEQAPYYLSGLDRPNHTRLMKNGLTFRNSYATDPVCSPSRAALFTGLYPWETGVIGNVDIYQNGPQLDPKYPTMGSVFKDAGYRTGYFGKWHLNWIVEDPVLVPADYDGSRRDQLKQYGFETSFIPTDSDDRPLGKRWDGETARLAGAWIRAAEAEGKPWLCVVSLINPHDIPFGSLYFDRPMPEYKVTMPKSWNEDMSGEAFPKELRRPEPVSVGRRNFPGAFGVAPVTEAEWREYIRRYYYLLQDCDRNVGTVLDALEQAGGNDNTLVFYTADHGEMASAHGRTAKGFMYEESVTVPLIISNPRKYKTAQTTEALASNIDLATTMAGSAGIKWPRPLHGIDLMRDRRDAVFAVAGGAVELKGLIKMVRTKDWKLVVYPSGGVQLFDMNNDIEELNNRVNDPSLHNVVQDLRARLDKEIA